MEILSEVNTHYNTWNTWSVIAVVLICIAILVAVAFLLWLLEYHEFADDGDKNFVSGTWVICGVVIAICISVIVHTNRMDSRPQYRVRIDDNTTVTELIDIYDVDYYDRGCDIWYVREKVTEDDSNK